MELSNSRVFATDIHPSLQWDQYQHQVEIFTSFFNNFVKQCNYIWKQLLNCVDMNSLIKFHPLVSLVVYRQKQHFAYLPAPAWTALSSVPILFCTPGIVKPTQPSWIGYPCPSPLHVKMKRMLRKILSMPKQLNERNGGQRQFLTCSKIINFGMCIAVSLLNAHSRKHSCFQCFLPQMQIF